MATTIAETKVEQTMIEPPEIEPPEIEEVESTIVACDGGADFGHPRVFLNLEGKAWIDCTYCGRRFVLKAGGNKTSGH